MKKKTIIVIVSVVLVCARNAWPIGQAFSFSV